MTQQTSSTLIEQFLLPDTPDAIAQTYAGLCEQAEQQDLGLLVDDFIVLDTETTGLSFKKCELIEIAAAHIENGQITNTFQTFVHPNSLIPEEITKLTHISHADVADAPCAEDAVSALADFVGGMPVLAHNATFDRTFIEKVRGGKLVSDTWIDTLALSRIALPRLSSHKLADLAQMFGCAAVSHRAIDDVVALAGVWPVILCGLLNLGPGLLRTLADMHEDVNWQFRPIFGYLARLQGEVPFLLEQIRRELLADDLSVRTDAAQLTQSLNPVTAKQIDEAFSKSGCVSQMYEAFELRPEQLQMAQEVREAQASDTSRSIEAGTGVGKSMAYLLPSIIFAQRNQITVGVATKTNALTDQLVSHELPALSSVLDQQVRYFALKGYEHYPCLRKALLATYMELPVQEVDTNMRSAATVAQDQLTAIAVTLAYSCQSPSGDLDSLGIKWRSVPRSLLTTTSEECVHNKCPFFPKLCFVHGARRRAASADVVVTNHSLLLRNVAAEGNILPPIRHWIIDEAHSLEDEARHQWAVEVSGYVAKTAFESIGGTRTGAIHELLVQAAGVEGSTLISGLLTKAASACTRASIATSEVFSAVADFCKEHNYSRGYDTQTIWISQQLRKSDSWQAVVEAAQPAIRALDEALKLVLEAQTKIAETIQKPQAELSSDLRSLTELLEGLKLIVAGEDASYVYSARVIRGRGGLINEALLAEKLDIGTELAEKWLPETMSTVFTSATIAVGNDFKHFNHSVGVDGLPVTKHKDVRLSSSFDYDNNMRVLVARDLPQPNDPNYISSLEDLLFDVHKAMGGSVLTLFTNRREMERVYEGLHPRLAAEGLSLSMQERGLATKQLSNKFLSQTSMSLFALKAFWEGFDAVGDTLRCVVIPKLPFANPNDPLSKERDVREERSWWKHSLPEAVISVKQAAGRLIRSSTDVGVLVLADPRLMTKGYGKQFLYSLPTNNYTALEAEHIGRYIELWRKSQN
ncbi:helicase C-terminal domain-containing protein [Atopobium fossor]|uniref:helicase C-terminal domain-containing protein n=1 Tax=Atopobium fossor TaxID=39487 RepID=UPI000407F61B|nr:helicase C-terminal domain-containing protein [Atopobium fossor]